MHMDGKTFEMNPFLKTMVRLAFVSLMTAVALRPVVVEASFSSGLGNGSPYHLSSRSQHEGQGLPLSSLRISKSQKFSSLKVLPKETVNFDGLFPRFAGFRLSLPSHFQSTAACESAGLSFLKPLVLRI